MRFGRFGIVAVALFLCAPFAPAAAGPVEHEFVAVRILHTNDIHGHIMPEPDYKSGIVPPPKLGGAAALATALSRLRTDPAFGRPPDAVLYLDAGDFFQGTPEGTLTQGEAMIELFHLLNLDVMSAGNHDFDLGPEQLERLVNMARFPVLSANTVDVHTGQVAYGMKSHVILERGGLKIGVFGLITEEMPSITVKSAIEGCTFLPAVETARRAASALKAEGAELIVGLTHAGTGTDTEIAEAVPGIVAIIGGHSPWELSPHFRSDSTQTVVVHTGAHNRHVGVLDILVHRASRKVVQTNSRLIRVYGSEFPPDKKIQDWAEKIAAKVGQELDVVVAQSDTSYIKSRYRECVIGNLLADAMRASTGSDAAFMNNRGIRGPIPAGAVKLRDVFTIMPFDNTITAMTLTGKDLMALLEEGASLERDILHMSGVEMEVDYGRPAGRRVKKALIDGKPVRKKMKYRIATNSFLADGGDLFETFTRGTDRADKGFLLRDAIRDMLIERARSAGGIFSGRREGRIRVAGQVPGNLRDD